MSARPTPADLEAARGRSIDDVIGPGLRVLFCGINPGLWSGATGFHFARPGNRFWKVLHLAGFTDRVLAPSENRELLASGLGVTNLVRRATAAESELRRDEFVAGAQRLRETVAIYRPRWLAVVGIGAYRIGFGDAKASAGRQALTIGGTGLWVLPNPSGLNASYQLPALTAAFRALREVAGGSLGDPEHAAKQESTRERRLRMLIDDSAAGRVIKPSRYGRSGRSAGRG